MQSDDLFIRKFRRQNQRPPIAAVNFDPKRETGVVEWPPRRDGDGAEADSLTPSRPEGLSKKSKPATSQVPQPVPYDNIVGGAWVRSFAHYDVQSILDRNAEDNEQSMMLDEGDGNDNELLLSCPHFRNETGGEEQAGLGRSQGRKGLWSSLRIPNDAVSVLEEPRESNVQQQGKSNYFIEHADLGAHYYRKYFYMKEHQNFFGIDERLGPVAISFRREEKEGSSGAQNNCRIIFRTTELKTLRGSILEESVPSAARHTTPRGLTPKRLLEFIMPELNQHCLRLASNSPKVRDTLLKLDEQGLNFQRKVGIMYCRAGQSSEEDMYNNESSGPAFEEFLDLLGERVRLKGWEKYRAQLDNKTDSTGTHSLYTRYQDYEIMFHVSTMLPYTANNTQQLLRKRHIGNDIVTIVFQEPGAMPFTPKSIRSHFQHVFIIVQVHEPCTENTYYRVAVTRSKDIPLFGPLFPKGARFPRSAAFRDFLLAKAVNAENAAEKSEKFRSMATRTRQEYLKDLAENYVTTTPIDSSTKFPLLSLGGKRKDKMKGAKGAELHSNGALVWAVMVNSIDEWEAGEHKLPCLLGVSAESVVLIERYSRKVVFNCSCRDVIGWKAVTEPKDGGPCLDIFYERGESVSISMMENQAEDIREVVQRLELVTRGCEALEVTPLRDGVGQPGFLMNEEGFVTELQRFCYAESGGLQLWARVVRLCGHSLVHLSLDERTRLLRTAHKIHITVIPPDENGKPRRWGREGSHGHVYDNVGLKVEHHIYENIGELRDATPDLILEVKPKVPLDDEQVKNQRAAAPLHLLSDTVVSPSSQTLSCLQFTGAEFGDDKASASDSSLSSSRLSSVDRAERNSRALSLHNSITKILSETTDSTEEEWQSISDLATACRNILEALSREGEELVTAALCCSDSPGHLEEKVSQLEAMLKKLQDDLQKEKEDKAVLQAEVQSLRQNNQRLQEESQSTVARLIKVTELLCNVNKPC
uniref:Rap-GAP domain-containing protein n=1 Tax=Oreochromis aureus TaxID=47969 RepID=A0A668UFQ2_OREAU